MNGADIIAVIILLAIVVAVVVYLLHWLYRHSSKDLSFVRTGWGGERVVMGGGAMVLPIVHDITEVSMNTLRIEVRRSNDKALITKNRMRIEVTVEFFVRVMPTPEAVAAAARTLGTRTMDSEKLRDLVQGRFVDAMGAVAASMTMEEIHEKRAAYIKAVRELVAPTLTETGLELETASLTSVDQADMKVFNPSNAFDAEGLTRLTEEIESRKKKRNDIEQDTRIAIQAKNLEAEKRSLAIEQESEQARLAQELEITVRRTQQRAEIAREKSERDREIEDVQIRMREEVERARIHQERNVESERVRRDEEIQKLEIASRRALEIEEQERVIAVSEKSRVQFLAQRAAEEARAEQVLAAEQVNTVRERETAQRHKAIELIRAEETAEREAIRVVRAAEAELKATADRAKAQITQAEADRIRFETEAEGRRRINDAENQRSDASRRSAVQEEMVRALPAIIRESVKPMEAIESIKILQVDGLPGLSGTAPAAAVTAEGEGGMPRSGSLADSAVSSALRYRAQVPFIDGLLREIGMSSGAITQTGGLQIFPAGEEPPAPKSH